MKYLLLISFFMGLLFLSGCGSKEEPNVQEKKQATKSFIPDHQLEALEKAKGVEDTLMDANKRRNESIENY
jgi:PBP1b-binding outer membrane lipoprotein LpoB